MRARTHNWSILLLKNERWDRPSYQISLVFFGIQWRLLSVFALLSKYWFRDSCVGVSVSNIRFVVDMPRWLFVESLLNNKNRIQNWLIDGFCVVLESSTNVLSMKAYLPFSLSGFLSKKSFVWSFLWSVCYSNHDTIWIFDSTFKVTPSLQFQKKLQIWI